MNRLTLNADGVINLKQQEITLQPLAYLGFQVSLHPVFRLRSYFKMLERYPSLQLVNECIPSQMALYRSCPGKGCTTTAFEHLEFGKTIEMIGLSDRPRMEIYTTLSGVSAQGREDLRAMPLERFLDSPVRLGRLRHIVFGDGVDVLTCDTVFSLFDLIDGIVWQLTFI